MTDELKNTSNVKQAVPFFMVVDMASSLNFYMEGLGFELKNKWEPQGSIEWCWLELDGASLMLQEYRNHTSIEKSGLGVSICFMCEDALIIYEQISLHGLSPAEPFVGNNLWVVQIKDPDGYNLIFESPTEVEEETRYSTWIKAKKAG